jgi:hypothetical protein
MLVAGAALLWTDYQMLELCGFGAGAKQNCLGSNDSLNYWILHKAYTACSSLKGYYMVT